MAFEYALQPRLPAPIAVVEGVAGDALQIRVSQRKRSRGFVRFLLQLNEKTLKSSVRSCVGILTKKHFHLFGVKRDLHVSGGCLLTL